MIKADINITGTIKRGATIRNDKNGKPYLSFVMVIHLTDPKGKEKEIEIFVADGKAQQSDVALYKEKRRVQISGKLDVRKKGEELAFYLNAEDITTKDVAALDSISGILHFRGHLRTDNVYEEKTDKNGKPYLTFSAYSSEKVGENFVSTWVSFMRFPAKDATIDSILPEWFKSKANVNIDGDFKLECYNGNVRLSSRVSDMNLYIKDQS